MERRKEKEGIYWSGNAEKIKAFFLFNKLGRFLKLSSARIMLCVCDSFLFLNAAG